VGLVTIFYCLRFETSLFVASYDSQGYGILCSDVLSAYISASVTTVLYLRVVSVE
jgi:hypothetical protein